MYYAFFCVDIMDTAVGSFSAFFSKLDHMLRDLKDCSSLDASSNLEEYIDDLSASVRVLDIVVTDGPPRGLPVDCVRLIEELRAIVCQVLRECRQAFQRRLLSRDITEAAQMTSEAIHTSNVGRPTLNIHQDQVR